MQFNIHKLYYAIGTSISNVAAFMINTGIRNVHVITNEMVLLHYDVLNLIVANPYNVSSSAPNTQIVGQSLTLECSVTTVRGITSRVDIVWSKDRSIISTLIGINISMSRGSTTEYSATYTIPQLGTTDDGRVYQCEVVINTSPPVMATSTITLNVIGLFNTSVLHLLPTIFCSSYS